MRPWKNFTGLASWLLRITVLLMLISLFIEVIMGLNFQSLPFLMAAGFALSGTFLFIGGFFSRHGVTMLSALALFILSGLHAFWAFDGLNDSFARFAMLGAVSMYFLANGNK